MKRFFLLPMLFIMACNNSEVKPTNADQVPTKEKQLRDAIVQYPDSAILVENLVQYFSENGNNSEALNSINAALTKDSLNARFWEIKANLHFENEDTLGTIKAFENSVRLYPDPGVIISLGVLYAQTGNPLALTLADALILANKAKAEKEAYFIKGLYASVKGDKKLAIAFFDKCISLNYSFVEAYREKAITLYDLGQYNEALTVLDRAVTLQNGFDEGYYYMGMCLEKLNRVPEAIEMYQRALMYDPGYIAAKEALAKLGVKS